MHVQGTCPPSEELINRVNWDWSGVMIRTKCARDPNDNLTVFNVDQTSYPFRSDKYGNLAISLHIFSIYYFST